MTAERHACRCRECVCSNGTDATREACSGCSAGIHRPPVAVQEHLAAGTEAWIRMMPVTLGSSGLSDSQLRGAREAWLDWHAKRRCPLRADVAVSS